jgi:RNA polymerase sigma factor (sigma-70 family)
MHNSAASPSKAVMTVHFGGLIASASSAQLSPAQQLTLAERIRDGEAAAEEEFVRQFQEKIACFVRVHTHEAEVSRDLTQDVLIAVVHALRAGRLREGERLAAFVYGVARNLVNNYARTRSRMPREAPLDAALHLASVPDRTEDAERAGLVTRALGELDVTDRTILRLTLAEGLKPGEISRRLGLTPEVVRSRKSRALKRVTERVRRWLRR